MSKNCIYEIFKFMGTVLKYTGVIPLPGLYEPKNASKILKKFISILPLFLLASNVYSCYGYLKFGDGKKNSHNLTDIVPFLIKVLMHSWHFISPLLYCFRMSPLLLNYLKKHQKVDQLLQSRKLRLKNFVFYFFTAINSLYAIRNVAFHYVRWASNDNKTYLVLFEEVASLILTFYTYLVLTTQPLVIYVSFQFVLRNAFQELSERIDSFENGQTSEENCRLLSEFRKLYLGLCDLSKYLDQVVSPFVVFHFVRSYLLIIHGATFISFASFQFFLMNLISILVNVILIIIVSSFSHSTNDAASKVLPTVYSKFDLNDKQIRNEINVFGLQSMYYKYKFSASGFFQIDRKLIHTMAQSIVSYWSIFYKVEHGF